MISGIYFIIHGKSMKRYIGQAENLDKRLKGHWSRLKNNTHDNDHLQNAYNKYGRDAFFVATTPCSIEDLTEREQYFIDTMWDMSYNICKIAGKPPSAAGNTWNRGRKHTKPVWNKGIPASAEARAKNSASNKGRTPWNKDKKGTGLHPVWKHAEEIKALRVAGLSYICIAKNYDCGRDTIRTICLSQ
jgi:group I intron endonuclease